MLNFKEQKYCIIMVLACIIIAVTIYQSNEMSRNALYRLSGVEKEKEGFTAFGTNIDTPVLTGIIPTTKIYETGALLDNIRSAQEIKYPRYDEAIAAFPVTATKLLEKQKEELGKINKGLQVGFMQELQNTEIETLKTRLEQVIKEGRETGVLVDADKTGKASGRDGRRLKHISSGVVFSTIWRGIGSLTDASTGFGVILDKSRGTCLKYINNNSKDGNNIDIIGCDFNPDMKSQRFRIRKIANNDTFNRALHPDYKMYAIPEYNTLNAYPYYIITPMDGDGTMCLTIDDEGISIEPCTNAISQRFVIII